MFLLFIRINFFYHIISITWIQLTPIKSTNFKPISRGVEDLPLLKPTLLKRKIWCNSPNLPIKLLTFMKPSKLGPKQSKKNLMQFSTVNGPKLTMQSDKLKKPFKTSDWHKRFPVKILEMFSKASIQTVWWKKSLNLTMSRVSLAKWKLKVSCLPNSWELSKILRTQLKDWLWKSEFMKADLTTTMIWSPKWLPKSRCSKKEWLEKLIKAKSLKSNIKWTSTLKFTKISNKKLIPIQTVELMTMLSKSFNKKSRELRPTLKMLRPGLKKLK